MTIERNPEGAWIISDIVAGYFITRRYYGYTKREDIGLFANEMRGKR